MISIFFFQECYMRKETRKKKRKKQTVLQPWKRKSSKTKKKSQRCNCHLWTAISLSKSSPPSSLSSSLGSSLSSSSSLASHYFIHIHRFLSMGLSGQTWTVTLPCCLSLFCKFHILWLWNFWLWLRKLLQCDWRWAGQRMCITTIQIKGCVRNFLRHIMYE